MWLCLSVSNLTNIALDSYFLSRASIVFTRRGRLDSRQPPSLLRTEVCSWMCVTKTGQKAISYPPALRVVLRWGWHIVGPRPAVRTGQIWYMVPGGEMDRGVVLATYRLPASSLRKIGTYLCRCMCHYGVDTDSSTLSRVQQRMLMDCDKVQ